MIFCITDLLLRPKGPTDTYLPCSYRLPTLNIVVIDNVVHNNLAIILVTGAQTMDNLQTLSELSIALIGFAGIVSAIKTDEAALRLRRIQMTGVFSIGLVGIIYALLPQVLFAADFEEATIWRLSSAALLVTNLLSAVIRWKNLSKTDKGSLKSGFIVHVPINLVWISAGVNAVLGTAWLYLFTLSCLLTAGMILFGTLLYLQQQVE